MHRGFGALLLAALCLTACSDERPFDYFVLALSWQPNFCTFNEARPECEQLDRADYAAGHLTLHGLWPSKAEGPHPTYCGVAQEVKAQDQSATWCQMPEPQVRPNTKAALSPVMPGAESCLDRHEWYKHGTCTGANAEVYFAGSLHLVEEFDKSEVGQVIANNVGRYISRTQLISAFEKKFLSDSAKAMTLICKENVGIVSLSEIRIALTPGNLGGAITRENLYLGAPPPTEGLCPDEFRIDPAAE